MDRAELIEYSLAELDKWDRILFEKTGNPLFMWDVVAMFRAWKRPIPEWCQEEMGALAGRILASSDAKVERPEKRIRTAVGVEPSHFKEFLRAERCEVYTSAMNYVRFFDYEGELRPEEDFISSDEGAASEAILHEEILQGNTLGEKSLDALSREFRRSPPSREERLAFMSRNYLGCELRKENE